MRVAVVCVCLALGGCAGAHLYSAQRDGFANTAKTAFAAADFDGFMKTRRANLDALHARDVQLAEARAKVDRDRAILAIFTSQTNWAQLDAGMNDADARLSVDTPASGPQDCARPAASGRLDVRCVLGLENQRGQHQADLDASADGFRLEWRAEPPACDG